MFLIHRAYTSSVLLIAFTIAAGLVPRHTAAMEAEQIAAILATGRQMMTRVVRVHVRDTNGRINIGSGVPVAPDLVATNCHVTRRAEAVELLVSSISGTLRITPIAQASSPSQDVCILRVADPLPLPPVNLGSAPTLGEPVVAIGFSGGMGIRIHAGEVTGLHEHEGAKVIQSSTAFNMGASGGGLFSGNGELIGLVTFRSRIGDAQYFSSPVQWIRSIIASQAFEPIAPLLAGRAFWEQSNEELPEFLRRLAPADAPETQMGRVDPAR